MAVLESDVVQLLNERLGGMSLKQAKGVLLEIQAERNALSTLETGQQAKVAAAHAAAMKAVENGLAVVAEAQISCQQHQTTCSKRVDDESEAVARASEQLGSLLRAKRYLAWLDELDRLCKELEATHELAISAAVGLYGDLLKMRAALQTSSCTNLRNAIEKAAVYWYGSLRERLVLDMQAALQALQWPRAVPRTQIANYGSSAAHLKLVFALLLDLQSPFEDNNTLENRQDKERLLAVAPLTLMLAPIKKRIAFHFSGRRETNRLDKPEWMFAYLLQQAKNHIPFLQFFAQPLLDARQMPMDVGVGLLYGMVQAINERLEANMEGYAKSRDLLSHVVDETLTFERTLREEYGYPNDLPISAHLFVDCPARFELWLDYEVDFCEQQYQLILSQQDAREVRHMVLSDLDTLKPTVAADSVSLLLQGVTERIKDLPSSRQQLRFVTRIHLSTLDDYLQRTAKEWTSQFHSNKPNTDTMASHALMANSINYLHTVVSAWQDQAVFVEMQNAPSGENSADTSQGPFDRVLAAYDQQRVVMVEGLVDTVLCALQPLLEVYRRQRWMVPHLSAQPIVPDLSPAASPLLARIKELLSLLDDAMAVPLFHKTWAMVARGLSHRLHAQLVLQNYFNSGGVAQLATDFRALMSLFRQYSSRPETYFQEAQDSLCLLQAAKTVGSQLQHLLENAEKPQGPVEVEWEKQAVDMLQAMGVQCLKTMEAQEVLGRFIEERG